MDPSSRDPVTAAITAVTIASTTAGDHPRFTDVLTGVLDTVDAGDHDHATHLLREFLVDVSATAATHTGVLTDAVVQDAARILVEQFTHGPHRPGAADRDDRTTAHASSGFDFLNSPAGPP
jgi:hypothetical protein